VSVSPYLEDGVHLQGRGLSPYARIVPYKHSREIKLRSGERVDPENPKCASVACRGHAKRRKYLEEEPTGVCLDSVEKFLDTCDKFRPN